MGGTAAALYAGHRDSFDHGHVLVDLQDRYLQVLEAVEATDGWATSVRASAPPLTLLGSLGGIEAGLRRQLRRVRPLETTEVEVAEGQVVRVPTALVERLSAPAPLDTAVTQELDRYRRLDPRWHDWSAGVAVCTDLADALLEQVEP